jgi:hypothetical protein
MLAASFPKDTGARSSGDYGSLIIHAKSAHIYDQEWEYMQQLLSLVGGES